MKNACNHTGLKLSLPTQNHTHIKAQSSCTKLRFAAIQKKTNCLKFNIWFSQAQIWSPLNSGRCTFFSEHDVRKRFTWRSWSPSSCEGVGLQASRKHFRKVYGCQPAFLLRHHCSAAFYHHENCFKKSNENAQSSALVQCRKSVWLPAS
jgi:hypothetical protein